MPRLMSQKNVFIVSDKKEVSGGFLLQPNICIGSLLICTYAVRDIMWKEILSYSRSVKLACFKSTLGGYIWLENIHYHTWKNALVLSS